MPDPMTYDRGPELVGIRITVADLLALLADPAKTEAEVATFYRVTPEQVAAGRAHAIAHPKDDSPPPRLRSGRRSAAGGAAGARRDAVTP